MMKDLGFSIRTFSRAIKCLKAAGYLQYERIGKGRRGVNNYKVYDPISMSNCQVSGEESLPKVKEKACQNGRWKPAKSKEEKKQVKETPKTNAEGENILDTQDQHYLNDPPNPNADDKPKTRSQGDGVAQGPPVDPATAQCLAKIKRWLKKYCPERSNRQDDYILPDPIGSNDARDLSRIICQSYKDCPDHEGYGNCADCNKLKQAILKWNRKTAIQNAGFCCGVDDDVRVMSVPSDLWETFQKTCGVCNDYLRWGLKQMDDCPKIKAFLEEAGV
jgi:hypothetical protein